jgi:RimJ/RimL family protein N-acetyltransferase
MGYGVDLAWRGRGIAGRAVDLVSRFLQPDLRVEAIVLFINKDNAPSIRVAEKLGFDRHDSRGCWRFSRRLR